MVATVDDRCIGVYCHEFEERMESLGPTKELMSVLLCPNLKLEWLGCCTQQECWEGDGEIGSREKVRAAMDLDKPLNLGPRWCEVIRIEQILCFDLYFIRVFFACFTVCSAMWLKRMGEFYEVEDKSYWNWQETNL